MDIQIRLKLIHLKIILIEAPVVGVINMFGTGTVMSIKEEESRLALAIHLAAPVLITITMIWAIYLRR